MCSDSEQVEGVQVNGIGEALRRKLARSTMCTWLLVDLRSEQAQACR